MKVQSLSRAARPMTVYWYPSVLGTVKRDLRVELAEANHPKLWRPPRVTLRVAPSEGRELIQPAEQDWLISLQQNQVMCQAQRQRRLQVMAQLRQPLGSMRLLPVPPEKLQAMGFAVRRGHAHRYWQDPDPSAFFLTERACRRCNRAVRCGGLPIFGRYRSQRTRHGLVHCDNNYSHSPRRRGPPA